MELSRLRGRPVAAAHGRVVGRVADIAVRPAETTPRATAVLVASGRTEQRLIDRGAVAHFGEQRVQLVGADLPASRDLAGDELLLWRDVVDSQVFDTAGHHFSRIGDVRLTRHDADLRLVGVEVGVRPVLRRLGLRHARTTRAELIDWGSIHLMSGRGHALQLDSGAASHLAPDDLAELLGRVPATRGARLLEAVPADIAAQALERAHPRVGARTLAAAEPELTARLMSGMRDDAAAAALDHLSLEDRDDLLRVVDPERAGDLRKRFRRGRPTVPGRRGTHSGWNRR